MLEVCSEDVITLGQNSLERHVQGIGAVEGEDETLWTLAVKELVEQMTGIVESTFGSQCHLVPGSAWIGEVLASEAVEGLVDGFGLGETRRCIVEVSHVCASRQKFTHPYPLHFAASQDQRNRFLGSIDPLYSIVSGFPNLGLGSSVWLCRLEALVRLWNPSHLRFRIAPAAGATNVPGFTAGTSPANRIPQVFKELKSLYRTKVGAAIPLSPDGDSPLAG
jgi:hypothetical protein